MSYQINFKVGNEITTAQLPENHFLIHIDKRAKEVCAMPQSLTNPLRPIPEINNYWSTDMRYNAVAEKQEDGRYWVGVNLGTVFILSDLFLRLLSHPNTFSHIGNAKEEVPPEELLDYNLHDFTSRILMGIKYQEQLLILPKDPLRKEVAEYFIDICMQFIFQHEVAHIVNGHLDYIQSKNGILPALSEAESVPNVGDVVRHTLEMDADSSSVNYFVNHWVDHYKRKREIDRLAFLFEDPFIGMFHLAYVFYMAFRVFGPTHTDPNVFLINNHPPTRMRQHIIFATISSILLSKYPEIDIKASVEGLNKSVLAAEIDYQNITGIPYGHTQAYHFAVLTKNAMEYIQSLTDTWIDIHPELSAFAFRKLSPPVKNTFVK